MNKADRQQLQAQQPQQTLQALKAQTKIINRITAGQLKALRTQQGCTMQILANQLGVAHSFIGKIEQCERRLDIGEFIFYCHSLQHDPVAVLRDIMAASIDLKRKQEQKPDHKHIQQQEA